MFDRLLKFAKLTPTEERDSKVLFVQSLFAGFGAAFFFVVANTFFIQQANISSLPQGYIMSGIFGYGLITLYKWLQGKVGIITAYSAGFIVYGIAGALLFWARGHYAGDPVATKVIAYIGFVVVLPFAAMQVLGFSTVSLRVFNIAQSKRLLALIGTGEVIASIIAYLAIPFLTKLMGGNAPLLLLSAIANIVATIPLQKIYRSNRQRFDSVKAHSAVKMNLAFFRSDRFFMGIAIVTVFSVAAVYFADYAYLLSVKYIANESGFEISSIVAVIFSVIKIGELLFSLLSARFIRSYGMKLSLLLLPALLAVSSLVGALSGVIFIGIPFFVVCFLLFNKWSERVVRKGVTIPAMKVLYQVTEPQERARLQATIDGTINQYATILAGIILLALSYVFKRYDDNILFFLKSISFVYVLVFAGWTFMTLSLFRTYKSRIRGYLQGLAKKKGHNTQHEVDTALRMGQGADEEYRNLLQQAITCSGAFMKKDVEEYIIFYNPYLKNLLAAHSSSLAHIKRAYYNNENFFSRLLIIWYMERQPDAEKVRFVKEYYGISELQLRVQMLAMMTAKNFHLPPEDVFFFTGLCHDNAAEMMWAYSCVNDLEGKVQPGLINALNDHIAALRNQMFELLKVLYEKKYIQAVQDIFNSPDRSEENVLFAVELLDSLLELQTKKMLVPLFEDMSFASRKEKLQKILLVYELGPEKRLKEILMTNFMTVSPYIKQLALAAYHKMTDDDTMLAAFASSSVENLSATARTLLSKKEDQVLTSKMNVVYKMNLPGEFDSYSLTSFTKWGLFSAVKKKHSGHAEHLHKQTFQFNNQYVASLNEGGAKLSMDILGLSLLFTLNRRVAATANEPHV